MTKPLLITTSFRPSADTVAYAERLARESGFVYQARDKQSIVKIIGDSPGCFVLSSQGLAYHSKTGQSFFFHPDTAILRIKAPRDPLVELVGNAPKRVLDTTMGLASDSIILAANGHEVTALESERIPYLIVSHGLKTFQSNDARLEAAMRAIKTLQTDSLSFLQKQADNSFDVVYCDPMFSEAIVESDNLSGLSQIANPWRMTPEWLKEAKRVARDKIILKAHFRDSTFEIFGFTRHVRPNQKFHYGEIILNQTGVKFFS